MFEKIKNKIIVFLIFMVSIFLCMPSVIYIFKNKTVDGFSNYYTYDLQEYTNQIEGQKNAFIIIGLMIAYGILYFLLIRNERKIFKNLKKIYIYILLISIIFMLILPYLSSDIFYYIADSWIATKYGENPYYTTVKDLQDKNITDEILENAGVWGKTTTIYGPLWNIIAFILTSFSFGKITVALFVYKFVYLIIHMINCIYLYKLTKSRKYLLIYGLNPLVLIDFLSNCHNDIFLVAFLLISFYYLIRKKNYYLSIIFLACSFSIKSSMIVIIPFIFLYLIKNENIKKCLLLSVIFIVISLSLYIPYYSDYTVFTNMMVQTNKYSQSVRLLLNNLLLFPKITSFISELILPLFVIAYTGIIFRVLLSDKKSILFVIRNYNLAMMLFIFLVLPTFQSWYILWLFPTIIWQRKNIRKFIIYSSSVTMISNYKYFVEGIDAFIYGYYYSINIVLIAVICVLIHSIYDCFKKRKIKIGN